jgi:hypothetical protein
MGLQHRVFLQLMLLPASMLRSAFASAIERLIERMREAWSACALCCVNTSLSGKMFFSPCWCIRDEVHSIPECTQRLSHLTSEGNMAKKAKKAKKAKSAVKKTAKKTRKVAKKKK